MDLGRIKEIGTEKGLTKWIPFGEDGAKVEVRFISKQMLNRITADSNATEFINGIMVEKPDDKKAQLELARQAVIGWEGLTSDGGKEYPFNDANRDYLVKHHYAFNQFVNKMSIDINRFNEEVEKQSTGKSETTSPGG